MRPVFAGSGFKQFDPIADTETQIGNCHLSRFIKASNNSIRLRILKLKTLFGEREIRYSFKQFDPIADTETESAIYNAHDSTNASNIGLTRMLPER